MGSSSKYKFANVFVADTKILLPVQNDSYRPRILVLDSKLNKCHSAIANCTSCCLQVEQSEFKRRSGLQLDNSCLANCGERRVIDIELDTELRLNGKLVILAISRGEDKNSESASVNNMINKCKVDFIWQYYRFEPKSREVLDKRRTYYALFGNNQIASITFDSLELRWNQQLKREVLSIILQQPKRKRNQQVVNGETILVSQLSCRQDDNLEKRLDTSRTSTINLLTIINRQLNETRNQPNQNPMSEAPFESSLNLQRSTEQSQDRREVSIRVPERSVLQDVRRKQSTIDQRLDTGEQFGSSVADINNFRYSTNLNGVNNTITRSSLNSTHLSDLNSTKFRLRSNGFLVLTVSSSFVILTYTLCLFIYLKSRQRFRTRHSRTDRRRDGEEKGRNNPATSGLSEISRPFNLQMSNATRTRLNVMLGDGIGLDSYMESEDVAKEKRSRRPKKLIPQRQCYKTVDLAREMGSNEAAIWDSFNQNQTIECSERNWLATSGDLGSDSYYGTSSLMRAICQAATLARVKLRNSRYRPNLNAIPESELEHLNSSRLRNETDTCNHLSSDNLDEFLRNAMSQNCVHSRQICASYKKPIETLFSSRNNQTGELDGQISRSRILDNVKGDSANVYDETGTTI